MALTTSGSIEPQRNLGADSDAAAVYGARGDLPSAVRVDRERGTSQVAADHTSGPTGSSAIGDPFIDGSSIKGATRPGGQTAKVPGSPGFPGLTGSSYRDGLPPSAA